MILDFPKKYDILILDLIKKNIIMFLTEVMASEVRPDIIKNQEEIHKVSYSSTAGTKVDIYPDKLQMRKRVYIDKFKCYKRLMVDADILEIPEDERERIINIQTKLNQAIQDLKDGKIYSICEGL